VDDGAFVDASAWVVHMTEPEFSGVGYQRLGRSERLGKLIDADGRKGAAGSNPAEITEGLTGMGLMVRLFARQFASAPIDRPTFLQDAGKVIVGVKPEWKGPVEANDFHGLFWCATAMHQVGGKERKAWTDAMNAALFFHQLPATAGCARGSWDPIDQWSGAGGRVYSTAMACLCLESYYRMDQLPNAK
jgi:hypothetical protein